MAVFLVFLAMLFYFPSMTPTAEPTETRTVPAAPPGKVLRSPGRATLDLKSMRPVVVAGRGFKPGENVRISGVGTKRVRASSSGTFTVKLGGSAEPCNGFTLFAIGSRGSRASLNFSQLFCREQ